MSRSRQACGPYGCDEPSCDGEGIAHVLLVNVAIHLIDALRRRRCLREDYSGTRDLEGSRDKGALLTTTKTRVGRNLRLEAFCAPSGGLYA